MGGLKDHEKRAERHLLGKVAWELLEFLSLIHISEPTRPY